MRQLVILPEVEPNTGVVLPCEHQWAFYPDFGTVCVYCGREWPVKACFYF